MNITWDQTVRLSAVLCAKLKVLYPPPKLNMLVLHAVPRGGLPVATLMAHLLDLPKTAIQLTGTLPVSGMYICIVDEIADTGKSLELEKQLAVRTLSSSLVDGASHRVLTAALITKHTCNPRPDISGLVYPGDDWITFAWEVGEHEDRRNRNDLGRTPEALDGVQQSDSTKTD